MYYNFLDKTDPEVSAAIKGEQERQENTIELIAAENLTDGAVMEANGSVFTNKYAEGYPGRRYFAGCEFVDKVEQIAIDRLKGLYGAEHANVQPHSGSLANIAVYLALLQYGDTIMGMDLEHGGHLSHGSQVHFSGRTYDFQRYGVDRETELLDYDQVREQALRVRPKLIITGASSYPRVIDYSKFREIADEVGAYLMVDMSHFAGEIAAGLDENPVKYADVVTSTTNKTLKGPRGGVILCKKELASAIDKAVFPGSQGGAMMHLVAAKAVCFGEAYTDEFKEYQRQVKANGRAMADALLERGFRLVTGGSDVHFSVVDLRDKGISGKKAQDILERVNIAVNKNSIPFDPKPPYFGSGIRLGTPAMTSRGFKEEDFVQTVDIIDRVLKDPDDEAVLEKARGEVAELCRTHPLYKQYI